MSGLLEYNYNNNQKSLNLIHSYIRSSMFTYKNVSLFDCVLLQITQGKDRAYLYMDEMSEKQIIESVAQAGKTARGDSNLNKALKEACKLIEAGEEEMVLGLFGY